MPSTSAQRQERQMLSLSVCVCECACTHINQELFSFKSISALTNLILNQCKMQCNTY